jgi:asparagine synthase (glutamine-hydrolysing)
MSTIAAVLRTAAREPSLEELRPMLEAGRYPGSLEPAAAGDDRCVVGACVLPLLDEDTLEPQPLGLQGIQVVFAGRLDNRAELAADLGVDAALPDARFAALAYQRWGLACPERLVGAFSMVVWDAPNERLFCATDHLALRPLFYSEAAQRFVVASTIRQVRAHGDVSGELDERFLLASLCVPTGPPLQSERTPYVGVTRLLRGSVLVVERDRRPRTWRYWRPEELAETAGTLDELGEELRARLETAVRAQSRSRKGLMCTLSGGLDSSTITGLASKLGGKEVSAASLVFGSGTEADETAYRRLAEQRYGVTATEIDGNECWQFRDIGPGEVSVTADEPYISYSAYRETRSFAEAARAAGCDVVFFGHGGDELMAGSEYFLADLLARGRLAELWRRSRELAGLSLWNRTYASCLRSLAVGPVLASLSPSSAGIQWDRPAVDLDRHWYRPPAPPWLPGDPAHRAEVDAIWREVTTVGQRPYSRAHELSWIRAAGLAPALNDCVYYPMGLEMRAPFYDRRVVELALSIPGERKLRIEGGTRVTKLVLRSAVRDLLPPEILERRTKASLSVGSANGLRNEWSRIWNDGRFDVAERGLVEWEPLARALRAARMGQWQNIGQLASVVVVELWLRANHVGEQRRREVSPHGARSV